MILVAAWAVMAPAPTAAALLARVQQTYAGAKQLTADFTQTATQAAFGRVTTSTGKLYVMRPDKLRMDYGGKSPKLFIVDGTYLWFVEPANLQVTQLPIGELPPAIAFLGGTTPQPGVAFDTSGTYGGKGATVLALAQSAGSAQHVFLVVDPVTAQVIESVVVESTGDTDDYKFTKTDTTATIKPSVFQFSPRSVPTYKVVVQLPPSAAPGKPIVTPVAPKP